MGGATERVTNLGCTQMLLIIVRNIRFGCIRLSIGPGTSLFQPGDGRIMTNESKKRWVSARLSIPGRPVTANA